MVDDPFRKVHERIDLVLDRMGEVRGDVGRIDERSKKTDLKLNEICRKIDNMQARALTPELLLTRHERDCPARMNYGVVGNGVQAVKRHPVMTISVLVLMAVQAIREAGLL